MCSLIGFELRTTSLLIRLFCLVNLFIRLSRTLGGLSTIVSETFWWIKFYSEGNGKIWLYFQFFLPLGLFSWISKFAKFWNCSIFKEILERSLISEVLVFLILVGYNPENFLGVLVEIPHGYFYMSNFWFLCKKGGQKV